MSTRASVLSAEELAQIRLLDTKARSAGRQAVRLRRIADRAEEDAGSAGARQCRLEEKATKLCQSRLQAALAAKFGKGLVVLLEELRGRGDRRGEVSLSIAIGWGADIRRFGNEKRNAWSGQRENEAIIRRRVLLGSDTEWKNSFRTKLFEGSVTQVADVVNGFRLSRREEARLRRVIARRQARRASRAAVSTQLASETSVSGGA